jgi:integrase
VAIRALIRTGARYGSEFCQLTAHHVEETPKGMIWRFGSDEHKTGAKTAKPRLIYVAPEIAEIVRQLVKRHRRGERLFRNCRGKPWNPKALRVSFERLRTKLKNAGTEFDDDACLYTCRHTFAKRTLTGYWTNKPCTLEYLAKLMGNTRAVCEKYAEWCPAYTDPLWDAIV